MAAETAGRRDLDQKRLHQLLAALRAFLYSEDGTEEEHHTFCAVYDPIQHGDCDCGWDKVAALLRMTERQVK